MNNLFKMPAIRRVWTVTGHRLLWMTLFNKTSIRLGAILVPNGNVRHIFNQDFFGFHADRIQFICRDVHLLLKLHYGRYRICWIIIRKNISLLMITETKKCNLLKTQFNPNFYSPRSLFNQNFRNMK